MNSAPRITNTSLTRTDTAMLTNTETYLDAPIASEARDLYDATRTRHRALVDAAPTFKRMTGFIEYLELLMNELMPKEQWLRIVNSNLEIAKLYGAGSSDFDDAVSLTLGAGTTMREAIRAGLVRRRNRAGQTFAEEIASQGVELEEAIQKGFSGAPRNRSVELTLDDVDTPEGIADAARRSNASFSAIHFAWDDTVRRSTARALVRKRERSLTPTNHERRTR